MSQWQGVVQVAFKVADLATATRRFHDELGAGPFFLNEHVTMAWLEVPGHDGEVVMDHSIALGQCGAVQIELVEHHRVEPVSLAAAIADLPYGAHHVAMMADSLDDELRAHESRGGRVLMRGSTGPVDFAFMQSATGAVLEFYERGEAILGVYDAVRAASEGWDGSRPVRDFEELRSLLAQ